MDPVPPRHGWRRRTVLACALSLVACRTLPTVSSQAAPASAPRLETAHGPLSPAKSREVLDASRRQPLRGSSPHVRHVGVIALQGDQTAGGSDPQHAMRILCQAEHVKALGGGKAGAVTTDFTKTGYEVTVTQTDGSTTEVHMDSSFNVVGGPGGGHGGAPSA